MSACPKHETVDPGSKQGFLQYLWGFMAIGGVTTLIDIIILYMLTEWIGLWYLSSALVSYCSGAFLSYTLNKTLNYRNQSSDYRNQGLMFLCISFCSLILNLGIVYTGVAWFGLSYIGAKIIATGIGFFLNYLGQTFITFRLWR
jgi:putative flippase GtrA